MMIVQFHNGIGHLARVSAIAKELEKIAQVTIFSGGRPVGFPVSSTIKFVQLPAMTWKAESGAALVPLDPHMTAEQCFNERSRILLESFQCNRPDIVITEFFPFTPGFYGTTLNALIDEINQTSPKPLLISSIRAFPRVTLLDSELEPDWIRERLLDNYHAVLHHADPAIFPLSSLGSFINKALEGVIVHQTGFVRKPINTEPSEQAQGILMTVGGGNAKSATLLKKWISSTRHLPKSLFPIHAVCGPLMSQEDRASIHQLAQPGVTVHDSVADLDCLMQACRAIVCMGGYNTLIEALSLQKPVLSFASGFHEDQHFQIDQYSQHGLLMKGDVNWTPEEIAQAIISVMNFKPNPSLAFDGAQRTAEIIQQLWKTEQNRTLSLS